MMMSIQELEAHRPQVTASMTGSSLQEGLTTEQQFGPRLASIADIDLSEGWATLSFWREAREREFSLIMSTPNALGCI